MDKSENQDETNVELEALFCKIDPNLKDKLDKFVLKQRLENKTAYDTQRKAVESALTAFLSSKLC